jgi:hypothetical protein
MINFKYLRETIRRLRREEHGFASLGNCAPNLQSRPLMGGPQIGIVTITNPSAFANYDLDSGQLNFNADTLMLTSVLDGVDGPSNPDILYGGNFGYIMVSFKRTGYTNQGNNVHILSNGVEPWVPFFNPGENGGFGTFLQVEPGAAFNRFYISVDSPVGHAGNQFTFIYTAGGIKNYFAPPG